MAVTPYRVVSNLVALVSLVSVIMAHEEEKIELSEADISSDSMITLRDAAFKMAFDKGVFVSPVATTTMGTPRYMAKFRHQPPRYEWLSRVATTQGFLDRNGYYPSGLFKFVATLNDSNLSPANVQVEQIFV